MGVERIRRANAYKVLSAVASTALDKFWLLLAVLLRALGMEHCFPPPPALHSPCLQLPSLPLPVPPLFSPPLPCPEQLKRGMAAVSPRSF